MEILWEDDAEDHGLIRGTVGPGTEAQGFDRLKKVSLRNLRIRQIITSINIFCIPALWQCARETLGTKQNARARELYAPAHEPDSFARPMFSAGDLGLLILIRPTIDALTGKSVPNLVNIINAATRPAIIDQAYLKSHPSFQPDWTLEG